MTPGRQSLEFVVSDRAWLLGWLMTSFQRLPTKRAVRRHPAEGNVQVNVPHGLHYYYSSTTTSICASTSAAATTITTLPLLIACTR